MKKLVIEFGDKISDTKIKVNGKQIGLVQSINVLVDVNNISPEIEVVFPDLRGQDYAGMVIQEILTENLELLSEIPFLRVKFRSLGEELPARATVRGSEKQWESSDLPDDPADLIDLSQYTAVTEDK